MRAALADGGGAIDVCDGSTVRTAVRQLRRNGGVDVIHAHMTKAELVSIAGAIGRRSSIVATRHFGLDRGVPRALDRAIRSQLVAEIAISNHVARACRTTTDTVISGVDPVEAVEGSAKLVLVAQRLEAEKSTGDAISAWAVSGLAADGWTMAVAGIGHEMEILAALAKRLGVADSIRFLGFVDDVGVLRSRAGIQIATCSTDAFGLSVAEAMAAGLPVIAGAGGGHLELLGDVPELLYPPGDIAALAVVMRRLASDLRLRQELGRRLRSIQQQHFTLSGHVDGLERIYQRVVS